MSVGTAIIALILVSVQGNSGSLTCKTTGSCAITILVATSCTNVPMPTTASTFTYLNFTELRWQAVK